MDFINLNSSGWGESRFWFWEDLRCKWRFLGNVKNPPLILIHGFGASSAHWRKNADFFVEHGFRVYGIDLIGFGESDQPGSFKYRKLDNYFWSKQLTSFIEEVVQCEKDEKTVLIGNSLGSLVALTTIAFRPDLVAAVIAAPLPDPALMQPISISKSKSKILIRIRNYLVNIFCYLIPLELLVPLIARTRLIKFALQAAYHSSIKDDVELHAIVAQPARRSTAPRALRSMCIGMSVRPLEVTAPDLLQRLTNRNYRSRMLLIWGREDKLVPLFLGKKIAEQYQWIDLLVIENTGHCPHDESPQEFNKHVLNWLELNLGSNG